MVISCYNSVRCAICLMGTCVTPLSLSLCFAAQRQHTANRLGKTRRILSVCVSCRVWTFFLNFILAFASVVDQKPNHKQLYSRFLSVPMAARRSGYCLSHGKLSSRVKMNDLCERIRVRSVAHTWNEQTIHSFTAWLSSPHRQTTIRCAAASSLYPRRSCCAAIFDSGKFVTRMCCVLQFNLIEI